MAIAGVSKLVPRDDHASFVKCSYAVVANVASGGDDTFRRMNRGLRFSLQVEHNKLAIELEALQEKRAEKMKAIEEVTAECNAVEEEIAELNRSQAAVREESSQLKKANYAAKDRVAGALSTLQQAQVPDLRKLGTGSLGSGVETFPQSKKNIAS